MSKILFLYIIWASQIIFVNIPIIGFFKSTPILFNWFSILKEGFLVGAQDCSIYAQGAYTGEISTKILKDIYCKFCVIGHSERRTLFGDNDEIVSQKENTNNFL